GDPGRPRRRRQAAGQDPHGRRLSGAVRAEKAEDLAGRGAEGDVLDGGTRAVALGESAGFDQGRDPGCGMRDAGCAIRHGLRGMGGAEFGRSGYGPGAATSTTWSAATLSRVVVLPSGQRTV